MVVQHHVVRALAGGLARSWGHGVFYHTGRGGDN
jgi:hypothetical protein